MRIYGDAWHTRRAAVLLNLALFLLCGVLASAHRHVAPHCAQQGDQCATENNFQDIEESRTQAGDALFRFSHRSVRSDPGNAGFKSVLPVKTFDFSALVWTANPRTFCIEASSPQPPRPLTL